MLDGDRAATGTTVRQADARTLLATLDAELPEVVELVVVELVVVELVVVELVVVEFEWSVVVEHQR